MENQLSMLEQAKVTIVDLAIKFGPKVVVAIIILVAGVYAGRSLGRMFDKSLARFHLDPPVRLLLVRLLRIVVFGLFLIMALQNLGVELLPLIAGLGVAGAGIALAMQGVLGNLVAGLTIIFTRPFRIGEYISIAGVEGLVEAIDIFNTQLSHADHSSIIVPNRKIVGEILHNYGQLRQLNVSVSIARSKDVASGLAAAKEVVSKNARALREPPPVIGVTKLDTGAINISVGPWVKAPEYAAASAEIYSAILEKFAATGIQYPMPPLDLRMANAASVAH
ncbi:MAG: mechanosensitive ion channel family protein [Burkholderiales bacterium]